MADVKEIVLKLLGKETVSDAARKAARGLDDMGDSADRAGKDTKGLNRALEDTHNALSRLKADARSSDDPLSFMKDINRHQRNLNNLKKLFADAGEDGAKGFGAQFVTRVGPLLARAPLSPPLIAAAAAAAPGIAAVVSGGVLAGLAGGVVVGGVAAAFRNPAVQAEAKSFGAELSQTIADATRSFVPATINGIKIVRGEVRKLGPDLKEISDIGASFVAPLTRGVTDLVRRAIPGIKDGLQESAPVVRSLERGLGQVGDAAGDALDSIGDGADGAAIAIGDLLTVAAMGVRNIGVAIGGLTKIYTFLRAATAVDKKAFAAEMADNAAASAVFEAELQNLIKGLRGEGTAAANTAGDLRTLAEKTRDVANANRDAIGTEVSFEEAIDNAGRAARDNGKSLDTNTEKGRTNMQALIDLRDATIEHAEKIRTATNSQELANGAMRRGYTAFINAAIAMGKTEAEAKQLAGAMGLIPTQKTITIRYPTMTSAEIKARALAAGINSIDTYKEILIVQRLQTKGVRISGVTGRGGFTERASGGPVGPGRTFLVGEQGPELVRFSSPGTVESASRTKAILGSARASGSSGARLAVSWAGGGGNAGDLGQALMKMLRYEIKVQGGGNVQSALGT